MTATPLTPRPTETEQANNARWAVMPASDLRALWIEHEAQARHNVRTGRCDPWPSLADYDVAQAAVNAALAAD